MGDIPVNETRPVFITARFRSGSTLLWNLFRSVPSFQAYYEPLHNALLAHLEHTPADHDGVDSYWDEYWPMVSWLEKTHREDFGVSRLHLEADDDYPELEQYIHGLIERSGDRTPVLQFNRVDFRLPWLRRRFPEALLIHMRRNPRDSWVSTMRCLPPEEWDEPRTNDSYDLLSWSLALAPCFPFLTTNDIACSYEPHYLLWRLSSLMGERLADCTLDFDVDFQADPARGMDRLTHAVPALSPCRERLLRMIKSNPPGKWRKYRSEEWFAAIERRCEGRLQELGLLEYFGRIPVSEIRARFAPAWEALRQVPNDRAVRRLLQMHSTSANHLLRVVSWNLRWRRDKSDLEVHRRNQECHIKFLESQTVALQAQAATLQAQAVEFNKAFECFRQRTEAAEAETTALQNRYGRTAQRVARLTQRVVAGLKSPFDRRQRRKLGGLIGPAACDAN